MEQENRILQDRHNAIRTSFQNHVNRSREWDAEIRRRHQNDLSLFASHQLKQQQQEERWQQEADRARQHRTELLQSTTAQNLQDVDATLRRLGLDDASGGGAAPTTGANNNSSSKTPVVLTEAQKKEENDARMKQIRLRKLEDLRSRREKLQRQYVADQQRQEANQGTAARLAVEASVVAGKALLDDDFAKTNEFQIKQEEKQRLKQQRAVYFDGERSRLKASFLDSDAAFAVVAAKQHEVDVQAFATLRAVHLDEEAHIQQAKHEDRTLYCRTLVDQLVDLAAEVAFRNYAVLGDGTLLRRVNPPSSEEWRKMKASQFGADVVATKHRQKLAGSRQADTASLGGPGSPMSLTGTMAGSARSLSGGDEASLAAALESKLAEAEAAQCEANSDDDDVPVDILARALQGDERRHQLAMEQTMSAVRSRLEATAKEHLAQSLQFIVKNSASYGVSGAAPLTSSGTAGASSTGAGATLRAHTNTNRLNSVSIASVALPAASTVAETLQSKWMTHAMEGFPAATFCVGDTLSGCGVLLQQAKSMNGVEVITPAVVAAQLESRRRASQAAEAAAAAAAAANPKGAGKPPAKPQTPQQPGAPRPSSSSNRGAGAGASTAGVPSMSAEMVQHLATLVAAHHATQVEALASQFFHQQTSGKGDAETSRSHGTETSATTPRLSIAPPTVHAASHPPILTVPRGLVLLQFPVEDSSFTKAFYAALDAAVRERQSSWDPRHSLGLQESPRGGQTSGGGSGAPVAAGRSRLVQAQAAAQQTAAAMMFPPLRIMATFFTASPLALLARYRALRNGTDTLLHPYWGAVPLALCPEALRPGAAGSDVAAFKEVEAKSLLVERSFDAWTCAVQQAAAAIPSPMPVDAADPELPQTVDTTAKVNTANKAPPTRKGLPSVWMTACKLPSESLLAEQVATTDGSTPTNSHGTFLPFGAEDILRVLSERSVPTDGSVLRSIQGDDAKGDTAASRPLAGDSPSIPGTIHQLFAEHVITELSRVHEQALLTGAAAGEEKKMLSFHHAVPSWFPPLSALPSVASLFGLNDVALREALWETETYHCLVHALQSWKPSAGGSEDASGRNQCKRVRERREQIESERRSLLISIRIKEILLSSGLHDAYQRCFSILTQDALTPLNGRFFAEAAVQLGIHSINQCGNIGTSGSEDRLYWRLCDEEQQRLSGKLGRVVDGLKAASAQNAASALHALLHVAALNAEDCVWQLFQGWETLLSRVRRSLRTQAAQRGAFQSSQSRPTGTHAAAGSGSSAASSMTTTPRSSPMTGGNAKSPQLRMAAIDDGVASLTSSFFPIDGADTSDEHVAQIEAVLHFSTVVPSVQTIEALLAQAPAAVGVAGGGPVDSDATRAMLLDTHGAALFQIAQELHWKVAHAVQGRLDAFWKMPNKEGDVGAWWGCHVPLGASFSVPVVAPPPSAYANLASSVNSLHGQSTSSAASPPSALLFVKPLIESLRAAFYSSAPAQFLANDRGMIGTTAALPVAQLSHQEDLRRRLSSGVQSWIVLVMKAASQHRAAIVADAARALSKEAALIPRPRSLLQLGFCTQLGGEQRVVNSDDAALHDAHVLQLLLHTCGLQDSRGMLTETQFVDALCSAQVSQLHVAFPGLSGHAHEAASEGLFLPQRGWTSMEQQQAKQSSPLVFRTPRDLKAMHKEAAAGSSFLHSATWLAMLVVNAVACVGSDEKDMQTTNKSPLAPSTAQLRTFIATLDRCLAQSKQPTLATLHSVWGLAPSSSSLSLPWWPALTADREHPIAVLRQLWLVLGGATSLSTHHCGLEAETDVSAVVQRLLRWMWSIAGTSSSGNGGTAAAIGCFELWAAIASSLSAPWAAPSSSSSSGRWASEAPTVPLSKVHVPILALSHLQQQVMTTIGSPQKEEEAGQSTLLFLRLLELSLAGSGPTASRSRGPTHNTPQGIEEEFHSGGESFDDISGSQTQTLQAAREAHHVAQMEARTVSTAVMERPDRRETVVTAASVLLVPQVTSDHLGLLLLTERMVVGKRHEQALCEPTVVVLRHQLSL